MTINSNIYAAADKTLTIKPGAGVTAVISGSNTTAILRLSGADYVTIDGSNNGTNSRNLTIANTSSSTSPAVIYVASATANGATNNTFKNLIVTGNSSTSTFGAIVSSSGITIGGVAEAANSNNSYINNVVSGAQWGMALVGPEGNESGTVVTGNLVGGTTAATRIGLRGIAIFQQQGVIISDNIVSGVYTSSTSISSGIYIAGAQSGGSITRNIVKDIRNTNTTGYGANGIQLGSSSTTGNVTVSNNFIYDIAGNGYSAGIAENDNGYGILVNAGGGYKIYYNSVWLNTNQTNAGLTAAINITNTVTTPNALDIRNNIFSNTQTTGTQRYAIYSGAAATVFEFLDYNDYYTAGGLNLGFIGSMRSNLAAWKAGTGKDVHSKSINPNFTSASDLHITGASELESAGIAVSVTTDYDGQTRPGPAGSVNGGGTAPDIGADEFDGIPADLTPPVITYTPLIATCSTGARTLTATITDELSPVPTSGSGLPVLYYRVNAGAYTAVQGVSIDNNQFEFTFGNGVAIADVVSYYIVAQDGATVPNVIAFPQAGTGGYTASPPASTTPPSTPSS
ncbi:hypothetical protein, partial [Nostoc linckia]|uniref:hypothetical protein n=1 Tax=Nostoc linckia TaxID=92942 RepID=UPI00117D5FAD